MPEVATVAGACPLIFATVGFGYVPLKSPPAAPFGEPEELQPLHVVTFSVPMVAVVEFTSAAYTSGQRAFGSPIQRALVSPVAQMGMNVHVFVS